MDRPDAGGEQGGDAGDVQDRVETLVDGRVDDVAGRGEVRGQDRGGVPSGEGDHAPAVQDGLAAVHRRGDRRGIGQVADHVSRPLEAQRAEHEIEPTRVTHQEPDVVAVIDQDPYRVRPR